MSKKVAIQGERASFHHIAATKFFGDDIELVCCDTFKGVFEAIKNKSADYAVCAIENSLFGSINESYDLLVKHHFFITGEVYSRIEQCLIGFPGTKIQTIQEVYSHPVALAQCEEYLDAKLPHAKRLESHDTAASVALVKERGDKTLAAIASRKAAELYGLEVLEAEIETNEHNYTRFVILEPKPRTMPKANKTSLIIGTSHKPGALYEALGAFAKNAINLTKLQSRPIIGKAWHYIFYVDVAAGLDDPRMAVALENLKKQDCSITVLGSYHAGDKT